MSRAGGKLAGVVTKIPVWFQAALSQFLCNGVVASYLVPTEVRWLGLRLLGGKIAICRVSARVFVGNVDNLSIGRGAFINYDCFIDSSASVTIGARVHLGPRVSILTSTHFDGGPFQRAGRIDKRDVRVGAGSWIGANAVVLPGVSIGDGAIIAAGAVVDKDCAAHCVYAGVPARFIKSVDQH